MSIDKKKANSKDESGSGTSTGGQTGAIQFRDFLKPDDTRDDLLPPNEIKRLLSTHNEKSKRSIEKQKAKRDQYKALKDGQLPLDQFRREHTGGGQSSFKPNPRLMNEAQFSGIDPQVNMNPNDFVAETNDELRNEHELVNRLRLTHAPKFNPTPKGPGL